MILQCEGGAEVLSADDLLAIARDREAEDELLGSALAYGELALHTHGQQPPSGWRRTRAREVNARVTSMAELRLPRGGFQPVRRVRLELLQGPEAFGQRVTVIPFVGNASVVEVLRDDQGQSYDYERHLGKRRPYEGILDAAKTAAFHGRSVPLDDIGGYALREYVHAMPYLLLDELENRE